MKHIFILNSFTLNDETQSVKTKIEQYCKEHNIDYIIEINSPDYETPTILEKYKNDKAIIIGVGGDGIINRILNGIIDTENILGFIPYGTGNDFYKTFKDQLIDEFNKCDIIKINNKYFINTACFGIDAQVANNKNIIKTILIPKKQKYNLALLYNFFKYKCLKFKVELDEREMEEYFTTIVIANGRYYGSGYNIGPTSELNDGLFELYLAPKMNKFNMLKLILKMKKGKHENSPFLSKHKTNKVKISSPNNMVANIDGEELEDKVFDIELHPEAVTIYHNEDLIKTLKK